jgi:DNA-binding transcriptional regulator YdaS (Cro superfamily)
VDKLTDSEIIDRLGGTSQVADLCKVQPQAVSQWRASGIPPARRMYLEVVRPEVFGQPASGKQESMRDVA